MATKERAPAKNSPSPRGRPRTDTTASPALDRDLLLEMYRLLVLTRQLDLRQWALNRQGKAPFVISGMGQEAAQIGSAFALKRGFDWFLPYYRDLGVVLSVGMTPREVMLALLAREGDPNSGGRQMPAHWGHRALKIVTGSSPVTTQITHAAGVALAAKLRGTGEVTIAYFGEGSTAKGDFHEGLNWAGIHRLPVIFFCENNGYAISVPAAKEMPVPDVAERAAGYGFPGVVVDGNDVLAVYEATYAAAERARRGEGATLIEAKTYRTTPHSSDDDDRLYRPREEVEAWRKKDPIDSYRRYLQEHNLLDKALEEEILAEANRLVDDATDFAEQAPYPRPEAALPHVYAD